MRKISPFGVGPVHQYPCYKCDGRGWDYNDSGDDTVVCFVCDGRGEINWLPPEGICAPSSARQTGLDRHDSFFGVGLFDLKHFLFMGIAGLVGIWLYMQILDLLSG
jgi:hypothetical protein